MSRRQPEIAKKGLWSALRIALPILATGLLAAAACLVARERMGLSPDYDIFWWSHHVADPYSGELTRVLGGSPDVLSYAYPPTFLLMTAAFAALPLLPGYALWVAGSGAALAAAVRSPWAILALLSPSVAIALLSGQTSVIIGAAIIAGLRLVERPVAAGLLIGVALSIKPQLGFLIPFGLLVTGRWRVILVTAATGLAIAAAATAAYGFEIWGRWLAAVPLVVKVNETTLAYKQVADIPAWAKLAALLVGAGLTWRAFLRGDAESQALTATATALLSSPYALRYDVAALAPALVCLVLRRGWRAAAALPVLALPGSPLTLALAIAAGWPGARGRPRRTG